MPDDTTYWSSAPIGHGPDAADICLASRLPEFATILPSVSIQHHVCGCPPSLTPRNKSSFQRAPFFHKSPFPDPSKLRLPPSPLYPLKKKIKPILAGCLFLRQASHYLFLTPPARGGGCCHLPSAITRVTAQRRPPFLTSCQGPVITRPSFPRTHFLGSQRNPRV